MGLGPEIVHLLQEILAAGEDRFQLVYRGYRWHTWSPKGAAVTRILTGNYQKSVRAAIMTADA
jgi:hypothetical protein